MFHLKDNLYFGRLADGSVRVLKFKTPPMMFPAADGIFAREDLLLDVAIDKDSWASLISSVSLGGEADHRFYSALKFHQSSGMVDIVPGVPNATPTPPWPAQEAICVQGDGNGGMDQVMANVDGSTSRRKVL